MFQLSQFIITMFLQEHVPSSAIIILIVISINSRHTIVWEGVSLRYWILNIWTCISSGPVVHIEFDIEVYSRFSDSKYWLHKFIFSLIYSKWGAILYWTSQGFNIYGGKFDVVIILNQILYGQSEASHLWYDYFRNGLLDCGFLVSKVDPWLFMYNTFISVLYVYYCLFLEYP